MNLRHRIGAAAIAFAAVVALNSTANAAFIDFRLTANKSTALNDAGGVPGRTLFLTAGAPSVGDPFSPFNVDFGRNGLGVERFFDLLPTIDGSFGNDVLRLAFSLPVKLNQALFGSVDPSDDVDVRVNGKFFDRINIGIDNPTAFNGAIGSQFEFVARDGILGGDLDSFRLAAINFTPISEPGVLALFGAGLICFGFAIRRREAANMIAG